VISFRFTDFCAQSEIEKIQMIDLSGQPSSILCDCIHDLITHFPDALVIVKARLSTTSEKTAPTNSFAADAGANCSNAKIIATVVNDAGEINEKTKKQKLSRSERLLRAKLNEFGKTTADAIRPFHMSRYHQRHIAMQLQYDGRPYYGFASQLGECDDTVEKYIFDALCKTRLITDRSESDYSRCGRTDKGVSALGQVVAFKLRSNMPHGSNSADMPRHPCDLLGLPEMKHVRAENEETADEMRVKLEQDTMIDEGMVTETCVNGSAAAGDLDSDNEKSKKNSKSSSGDVKSAKGVQEIDYCDMLNRCLPREIRVLGWTEVSPDFNARFSASGRKYKYFFLKKKLNIASMEEAASLLVGEHDFRNFCKMNIAEVSNFTREIYSARVVEFMVNEAEPDRSVYILEIEGIAFLWHMVRCCMAVLFLVGEGRETPAIVTQLLDVKKNQGKPNYHMAAEEPLVLHSCAFDNLSFKWTPKTLWGLTEHYERLYDQHSVAAAQALNSLRYV